MKNSLFTQMIYRIVLCCVAGLATLLSFRFFYNVYTNDSTWDFVKGVSDLNLNFLKYYTNISNWLVFGVSVAVLADNVKRVRAGEKYGHNRVVPALKFMTTVMIAVTFLVYSTMLENPFTIRYWRNLYNLSCHVFSPVLFVLDFMLFDEHRTVKVYYPVLGLIFPLIYFFYILLLGACIPDFKYPYFFLDVDKYGYGIVGLGVLAFTAGFLIIGYLLWLYDKLIKVNGKWKLVFSRSFQR
ncbi:MAG: Pr6Pr family membrane protein [Clostridia bacterium]|nr:Pr6Pr family membrane protein [Clostridia bacterium]